MLGGRLLVEGVGFSMDKLHKSVAENGCIHESTRVPKELDDALWIRGSTVA